jgi:hypothetical protein
MPTNIDLAQAVVGEDELGVVVRAHIHIEYELEQFLIAALPRPEEMGRLEYATRVRLALAAGLNRSLRSPLNSLGSMRNKFSHQLEAKITTKDMLDFHNTFGTTEKAAIEHAFEVMRSNAQNGSFTTVKALSEKDKFVLFAGGLRAAVQYETLKLKAQRPISN